MDASQVIAAYERTGRYFSAGGVQSFVIDEGQGEAVVCVHGVPASAFLYRKVVRELAARGLRGIAFDLPGLGLAERPRRWAWTGSTLSSTTSGVRSASRSPPRYQNGLAPSLC
jgi:haloalkane dehalogenase